MRSNQLSEERAMSPYSCSWVVVAFEMTRCSATPGAYL
jgi:hypothetical protein